MKTQPGCLRRRAGCLSAWALAANGRRWLRGLRAAPADAAARPRPLGSLTEEIFWLSGAHTSCWECWAHQCAVVSTQWVGARHVSHVERWSRVLGGAAAVSFGAAGAAFQLGDATAAVQKRRRRSLLWLFSGRAPDRRHCHQRIYYQRQLVSFLLFIYIVSCVRTCQLFGSKDLAITRRQMQIIERAPLHLCRHCKVSLVFRASADLSPELVLGEQFPIADWPPPTPLRVGPIAKSPAEHRIADLAISAAANRDFSVFLVEKGLRILCTWPQVRLRLPGRHDGKQVRGEGECISLALGAYNRIRRVPRALSRGKRCHRLAFSEGVALKAFFFTAV